ncbi:fatty acyl-CoA hydrolase precursor, medium chain-like [Clavelina lepadiformis]|uniref:fatty acyl-CoA hydrolase precursor, medium chain-like n=1 Tax=Clavelina lepadiformis TaxID=159417 RepID=UPI00404275D7
MALVCPVVEIANGKVRGRVCLRAKPEEAKQVFNFAGIPFAKPPVGELRFEPPQKCEPWEGVLEATKLSASPLQSVELNDYVDRYVPARNEFGDDFRNFSEDCLYLNVFTSNPSKAANMPVMVWIYGGSYQIGGSGNYSGQALCGLHDVVLVVPNYRLNVFGFFTTGRDTPYPGNMGLLDQVMALEWTRDNIREFGGNPDNVTIFGESVGAVSVGAHSLSPLSKGLFHRTIQHSGTAAMELYMRKDYAPSVKKLLEVLKVEATDPKEIVAKLKKVPAQELINATETLHTSLLSFFAHVDGRVLAEDPATLIEKKQFSNVPSIIGFNNSEGSGLFMKHMPKDFFDGYSEEAFDATIKSRLPYMISGLEPDKTDDALRRIKEVYGSEFEEDGKFKWSSVSAALFGDHLFVFTTIDQLHAHSKTGYGTYLYHMTHQLKCHHDDEFKGEISKKAEFCRCDHTDDIIFTFGEPLMNGEMTKRVKFSKEEEEISRKWMTYIANFATSGNPNKGSEVEVEWPQYDVTKQRHLLVQNPLSHGDHLAESRYKLWKETLPNL